MFRTIAIGFAAILLVVGCSASISPPAEPHSTSASPSPTVAPRSTETPTLAANAPSLTIATPPPTLPTQLTTPSANTTSTSISPDGRWRALITVDLPLSSGTDKYHVQFKVTSIDGKVSWTIVDAALPFGPGYTTPALVKWSEDGQALYYANAPLPDGCDVFTNGQDLNRVDLKTGHVQEIVPKSGHVISVSPGEKTVAIIADGQPQTLIVRDLATGAERRVVLDATDQDAQAGSLIWSPDEKALALTLAARPCDPDHWLHSVVRVDLPSLKLTTLIHDSPRYIRTFEWRTPTIIAIESGKGNFVLIDAVTGGSPTR